MLRPSVGRLHCSIGVVRASSMILCASCAVVVQIFLPLTTKPLPLRSALVLIFDVLSPASGSVTPKQVIVLPWIRSGSQRAFCSGVPNTTIGCGPKMLMWIADAALIPPDDRATACIRIAASVTPRSAPPYASGMAMPSQPASAIA